MGDKKDGTVGEDPAEPDLFEGNQEKRRGLGLAPPQVPS